MRPRRLPMVVNRTSFAECGLRHAKRQHYELGAASAMSSVRFNVRNALTPARYRSHLDNSHQRFVEFPIMHSAATVELEDAAALAHTTDAEAMTDDNFASIVSAVEEVTLFHAKRKAAGPCIDRRASRRSVCSFGW